MSTVFENMIELGAKQLSDAETIAGFARRLRPLAEGLDPEWADRAGKALDFMEASAGVLSELAPVGLIGLTGTYLELGEVEAEEQYIRHHASFGEAMAAQRASAKDAAREHADSGWDKVFDVVKAIAPVLPQLIALAL